ncbi:MAG: phosphoglucosamine mutase [Candidatus Paceibacterota bacterium]|jgi:phosphomannomutase
MTPQPKLTVSGYRGIWGESLTPLIIENYVSAFIQFVKEDINDKPTILLGRDGRESGPDIKKIVTRTLQKLGVNFIDGDILPTPTVLFAVRKHKYDSAIIITASHNPREYNGLKFVTNKALFTDEKEVAKIKENYEKITNKNKLQQNILSESTHKTLLGFCSARPVGLRKSFIKNILSSFIKKINFPKEHADQILKHINVEKIRAHKFKVAVDMINASACVLDPYLFEQLGVELIPLNNIPDGKFAHKPEPLRENLGDIAQLVKEKNCNLGFAHDPDADRLIVINEKGEAISEEYTLALGVEAILSKNHNNIAVVNMSTSQMNRDIAEKYGGKCIRTKVGEANVVAGILENNAIIGGEGGGGIIYPTINMARDSFVSLALILELLAERDQTVTECLETLPKYEMCKDKVSVVGSLEEMYLKMKNHFKNGTINELDGLRLDFPDNSWIHLRPSNTEPIVRLYGEAQTKERITELFKEAHAVLA